MGPLRSALALCAIALIAAAPARAADEDLARHVDPMIGTFAPGFIFPGAAAPFGMVQNSPDTRGEFAYSGYLWSDPAIQAFSLVHLSGPGVKKGGDIPVMPVLGEPSLDPNQIQSPYDHATEKAEPGYYSVFLAKPATKVELTASEHAGMQRYTFPPAGGPKLVFDPARSDRGRRRRRLPRDRRPRGGRLAARALPGLLRRPLQPPVRLERHDRQGRLGRLGRGRRGDRQLRALVRGRGRRAAQPRGRGAGLRFRRDAVRDARGVEPRAVEGPRQRRLRPRPEVLLHRALPLAAPPEHVHRRGRALPRHGRPDPRGEGPDPVLELLVVGPLQVLAPADRDDPAGALPRHAAQPAGRPPRGRLHAALEGAVDRRRPHVGRPGDPDGRRRRLPRAREEEGGGRALRRREAPGHAARPGAAPARLAARPAGHDARVRRRRLRAGAASRTGSATTPRRPSTCSAR